MTYYQLYETGKIELERNQIKEAALNARLLLEFICKTNRNELYAHGEREVSAEETESYMEIIMKRSKHEPLQYLTGEQDFMGLSFRTAACTLIPRQDTEILVEEVLLQLHDGMDILDMCTGSGCILLSLLHYSNDCKGVGTDISQPSIELAKENARRLGLEAKFIQSDLFEYVKGRFDIIVSNPPYIERSEIENLDLEVKQFEPQAALDGGEDGLIFYRRICADAKAHLFRGGQLFFEIGCNQAEAVCGLFKEYGYHDIEVRKDLTGLDRVVFATFTEE